MTDKHWMGTMTDFTYQTNYMYVESVENNKLVKTKQIKTAFSNKVGILLCTVKITSSAATVCGENYIYKKKEVYVFYIPSNTNKRQDVEKCLN